MTAATNTLENGLLALLFNNTTFADLGDAAGLLGSTAGGSLYVSLHTANPGEAGNQGTSETTYGGYARVGVARTAGGWTVTGSVASNTASVQFPACTSGASTVTHIGIGTAASGTGKLLWSAAFDDPASLAVSPGIAPKFDPATINVTVD
jgi:hypothetical protein